MNLLHPLKNRNKQTGFTLIELLLVVSVISIIALTSTTFYINILNQNATVTTSIQLVNQLRKAQLYAMMGKRNSAWGIHFASQRLTLFKGTTYGVDNSFNENLSVNQSTVITGLTDVVFSKSTGLPTTTPTITITNNSKSKTITINAQGVINLN